MAGVEKVRELFSWGKKVILQFWEVCKRYFRDEMLLSLTVSGTLTDLSPHSSPSGRLRSTSTTWLARSEERQVTWHLEPVRRSPLQSLLSWSNFTSTFYQHETFLFVAVCSPLSPCVSLENKKWDSNPRLRGGEIIILRSQLVVILMVSCQAPSLALIYFDIQ